VQVTEGGLKVEYLDDRQRGTLTNALRIAADRFKDHINTLRAIMWEHGSDPEVGSTKRLIDVFQKQVDESALLAEQIDNSTDVVFYAEP
jgi:hypothetical protein